MKQLTMWYQKNFSKSTDRLYYIPMILLIIVLYACNAAEAPQTKMAFSMSDTMLRSSSFAVSRIEQVKEELKLYGKIVPDNNKLVEIFPIVGGVVTKVNIELGDYVQKGQVLAEIRSGEVANYQKQKLDAISDLSTAEKNVQVATDLLSSKLNSEKDVIAAQNEYNKAAAELERIKEMFRIYTMSGASSYTVKAPINGFIIQKNINVDMQLRSDRSDNIFDIAQIDDIWVLANVNETDIAKIKLGIEAEVRTLSYADKSFSGNVDKIFNFIDPDTKAMKVRIKIHNKGYELKPEMAATVMLRFNNSKFLVAVPSAAVIFDKSKHFVMVFKDRANIETRQIEIYRQVGETTWVTSGLAQDEKVMTKNQLLVYDALND